MNTYQHFDSLLQGRNQWSRRLANNTYLRRNGDGTLAIRLHDTDVVTYHPGGTVFLDSGGWDTPTTFARIEEYGPGKPYAVRIGTKNRIPYISIKQGKDSDVHDDYWSSMSTYRWQGSMTLQQAEDGTLTVVSDVMTQEQEKLLADYHKHLEKLIKRYVKPLNAALTWELLNDMAGDCWYCSMYTVEDAEKSLGDAFKNVSHLYEHLVDEYRMGSLIRNAYHAKHYTDIALQMDCYQGKESYGGTERMQDNVRKYFRDKLYNNMAMAERFDAERKQPVER